MLLGKGSNVTTTHSSKYHRHGHEYMVRQLKWSPWLHELPKSVGGFPKETMMDVVACPLPRAPTNTAGAWDPSAMNEATEHGNAQGGFFSHQSPPRPAWEGAQGGGCSLHPLGAGHPLGTHSLAEPRGDTRGMEERPPWPRATIPPSQT